jgi:hypothetical protein
MCAIVMLCCGCAGLYGATTGLNNAACSGPCAAGRYGNAVGLTLSSCTGACTGGHYCPPGSTNNTVIQCQPGTYAISGQAMDCLPCPGLCVCVCGILLKEGVGGGGWGVECLGMGLEEGAHLRFSRAHCCVICGVVMVWSWCGMPSPTLALHTAGTFGATAGANNAACSGQCLAGW